MAIPWDKVDDLAEVEKYVKKCESIRQELGLLSRAEEYAAINEVAMRASGGNVRKYRAMLEANAAVPDSLAYNAAVEQAERELGVALSLEDKDTMVKFEKIRKQVYTEMKVPYDADPAATVLRDQVRAVQSELKGRKEFRDAAMQRVVKDLEEDNFAAQ